LLHIKDKSEKRLELNGKKILITGADGFIGSHLIETLLKKSCHLKAFVYYNSFNSWGWLDNVSNEKLSEIEILEGN